MQATFIVKNLTPDTLDSLAAMSPRDAHAKLLRWAIGDLRHCVTQKCGSGSFGDRVRWNTVFKSGKEIRMSRAPRRGYTLFTFEEV